jgi:hypothetical protein
MGYIYKESRVFISKEEILMRVTQEEIIKDVFGFLPREHRYVSSPFRKDKTPDCYFEWYKGLFYFIDWAEPIHKKHHRDCFNVIQDWYGVSFYKALEIINEHFKLDLLTGHSDDSEYVKRKMLQIKESKEKVKDLRKVSLKEEGEFGVGNLVFKLLRRNGYIGKIIGLKRDSYDNKFG